MNVIEVLKVLKHKYPHKKIIKNDPTDPSEIICEVDPASEHPHYSLAIAVIDKSAPHRHEKSIEIYKVIKGFLTLHVDQKIVRLTANEEFIINPGLLHWAEGEETWVSCYSEPGWTPEDCLLS